MAGLRSRIPWWARIGAKLVLSRVPVRYELWRRLSVFRHGAMDEPEYAYRVFAQHFERLTPRPPNGFVSVELGPGDSLFSVLVGRAFGASRCYVIDTGEYASRDLEGYVAMARYLRARGLTLPDVSGCRSLEELLSRLGGVYATRGADSLRELPAGSVDFVWSQAVLEHVRRRDLFRLLRESRRILRPDGACSHSVDLQDHLQGALNNLRFPEWFWENDAVARSGFYTNRVRFTEMIGLFEQAGFRVDVVGIGRWDSLPTRRRRLAAPFRDLSDEELRVSGFDVILRPAP